MDISIIAHLAKQYEEGRRDPEATLAFACREAYQQGFDDGVEQAEEKMRQTQMLLMFTAGNA
jgi:flagellar biosynthesis/type III secretory pathway protein FliH|tara:strand:+ start:70 stop:255 length:186 start_codon:yes stop_codon:yes gene_type:complete